MRLNYLQTSRRASAHYLISKAGAIYQFLDPRTLRRLARRAIAFAFGNQRGIGLDARKRARSPPRSSDPHRLVDAPI